MTAMPTKPTTLADTGARLRDGEPVKVALYEFLDEVDRFARRADDVAPLIAAEPPATGSERLDALLAAVAEHVAHHHGAPRPDWCVRPERFLEAFWFVLANPAYDAVAVRDSPAAFRRRGVLVPPSFLERV